MRGRLPLGSLIVLMNCLGGTSPVVNVLPPITRFERRTFFSAPYARSSTFAYARGPFEESRGIGLNCAGREGSPQIIQWRTRPYLRAAAVRKAPKSRASLGRQTRSRFPFAHPGVYCA
jgi:hypothetical protein